MENHQKTNNHKDYLFEWYGEDFSALYHAYDGNCFYCGKKLEYPDISFMDNIDLVIPAKYEDSPILAVLMDIFQLVPEFTTNDFQNVVPCHKKCKDVRKTQKLKITERNIVIQGMNDLKTTKQQLVKTVKKRELIKEIYEQIMTP
jgi:hypothetical protein